MKSKHLVYTFNIFNHNHNYNKNNMGNKFSHNYSNSNHDSKIQLRKFINSGDYTNIRELISENKNLLNINITSWVSPRTPLMEACRIGDIKCIELLLELGANVNCRYLEVNPLIYTIQYNSGDNSIKIIKLLIAKGLCVRRNDMKRIKRLDLNIEDYYYIKDVYKKRATVKIEEYDSNLVAQLDIDD